MKVYNIDVELEALYDCTAGGISHVLYPLISFACAFKANKTHNMLALILDP